MKVKASSLMINLGLRASHHAKQAMGIFRRSSTPEENKLRAVAKVRRKQAAESRRINRQIARDRGRKVR